MNKSKFVSVTLNYDNIEIEIDVDYKENLQDILNKINKFRVKPFKEVFDKGGISLNLKITMGELPQHNFNLK